uniref:Histone-lysine N-methyltransferase SETD7 n=1 Tax=Halocynthia roretzi TaxID=7729 RepID=SETD7_HALRO|nr:RecName: Full=Histone-lysine N-methyltransferase SETD7; AltName: Full=SET domain-containing protein 7 [Halocynthia roretzi]AAM96825.1 lysine methyltransferase [Halocynthia roretzi]
MDSSDDEIACDEGDYKGAKDDNDLPHGLGKVKFSSGDEFIGAFEHGIKCGPGKFHFFDDSTLEGNYVDGELHGIGIYTNDDGSITKSTYCEGVMEGPSWEYDPEGNITFRGQYSEGVRCGLCFYYFPDGGSLIGNVNASGDLSADNIAYIYPDRTTALIGSFEEGDMITAKEANVTITGEKGEEISFPTVNSISPDPVYRLDVSTPHVISTRPLVPDPYESELVYAAPSKIPNAGEGLYAKCDVDQDTVMAFYNGVRLKQDEVENRDWSQNSNTISLTDDIAIDVPEEYVSTDNYCASLGHKVNHSFDPNCRYDIYQHPRFGFIKCVRTIRGVSEGDELTVHYTYEHNDGNKTREAEAPEWYKSQLKVFGVDRPAEILENMDEDYC